MYRHDNILRLIERLGASLVALRDRILKRAREDTTVHAEIVEIAQQAGLDLAVARQLAPELLLAWLAPTGEPDPAKLWLMAELLYLDGLHAKEAGSEWRGNLERALALLARLPEDWRPGPAFPAVGERASEIRELTGLSQR